ncbi:unnamed protein product [Durusdinium trenchii]|uniref:Inositol-pentakisphosphate 2-kinase n=1 Tax=Durusdinium trenchii TaxID=1381693 RepID=A0ABP0IDM7_9DINO
MDAVPEGVITVELKPGCGLLELYGQPGLYHMQDQSLLRSAEMAKGGRYSAPDLFSGRKDRVLRALEALCEGPTTTAGDAELQVLLDDRLASQEEAVELLKLEVPGANTSSPLLSIVADLLDARGEAFPMLPGILRAQCAGRALNASCAQLWETLGRSAPHWRPTREEMENAMKRGYWSLPADQSGLHSREREAERLLDRAKREMWQEGSQSRLELEKQIRKFLCLHLLGDAACEVRLRINLVRPSDAQQEVLSEYRFAPLPGMPDIWCRVEMAPLHLKLST